MIFSVSFANQVSVVAPPATRSTLQLSSADIQSLEDSLVKNTVIDLRKIEQVINRDINLYQSSKSETKFENLFFLIQLYREAVILKSSKDATAIEQSAKFDLFVDRELKTISRDFAAKILSLMEAYLAKRALPHISEIHIRYILSKRNLVYGSKVKIKLWKSLITSLEEQGLVKKALEEALIWSEMRETEANRFEALYSVMAFDFVGRPDIYKMVDEKIRKLILPRNEPRLYLVKSLFALRNKDYKQCEAVYNEAKKDTTVPAEILLSLEARLKRCYIADNKVDDAEKLRTVDVLPVNAVAGIWGQMYRADILLAATRKNFSKAFSLCNKAPSHLSLSAYYSFLKIFATCKVLQSEGDIMPESNLTGFSKGIAALKEYEKKSEEIRALLRLIAELDAKNLHKDTMNTIRNTFRSDDILVQVLNIKYPESAK